MPYSIHYWEWQYHVKANVNEVAFDLYKRFFLFERFVHVYISSKTRTHLLGNLPRAGAVELARDGPCPRYHYY